MANEKESLTNVFGNIIVFSFFSVIIFFVAMLILGGINNYALQKVYEIFVQLIGDGVVHSDFQVVADSLTGLVEYVSYLDVLWLGSFIVLAIGSVVISYNIRRNNLFNTFQMSVFGMIILIYVGGIFIELTDWFTTEILYSVFPNLVNQTPFFSWYLDNVGVINLVLIVLCIIANFIELDFLKFENSKGGGDVGEI